MLRFGQTIFTESAPRPIQSISCTHLGFGHHARQAKLQSLVMKNEAMMLNSTLFVLHKTSLICFWVARNHFYCINQGQCCSSNKCVAQGLIPPPPPPNRKCLSLSCIPDSMASLMPLCLIRGPPSAIVKNPIHSVVVPCSMLFPPPPHPG